MQFVGCTPQINSKAVLHQLAAVRLAGALLANLVLLKLHLQQLIVASEHMGSLAWRREP